MQSSQNPLVLGGASWNTMVHLDHFPQPKPQTITNGRFVEGAGSTGIGKAFSLHALGISSTLHIALGTDSLALKINEECQSRDIKLIIDQFEGETAQHLNLMDGQGGRISIFRTNGPDQIEIDLARMQSAIEKSDVIYVNLAASTLPLLPIVEKAQATIITDLHDYDGSNPWYDPFIQCADIIQLSNENLEAPNAIIAKLLQGRAKLAILTKGADGAEIWQENNCLPIKPYPAKLKDSNGAGDTFCVAFTQQYLSGKSIKEAGEFAARCAAQTVETDAIAPISFNP